MKKLTLFSIVIFLLLACENKKKNNENITVVKTKKSQRKTKNYPKEITLIINGSDQMQFDKKKFNVRAGQTITLTLNHTGKMGKNAMGHNWVLLKKGVSLSKFANKSMNAADKEYIGNLEDVIAHTKLLGGGESTTIKFTAPKKGVYDFLCSFPGHYALMKGKFIVE